MSDAVLPDPVPEAERSPHSRALYVALALVVGSIGGHNFYARRWLCGAGQFLLSVPSFWVMAEWLGDARPALAALSGNDPETVLAGLSELTQIGVPGSPLLLGALASGIWAAFDLFLVKTDGAGRRLR